MTVMALMAFGSCFIASPARVVIWPAVTVISAGIFVTALAQAFYYHFGAWGSLELEGKSADAVAAFVASLQIVTEYVTCLTRFGRVFPGLGMLFLGFALLHWKILPSLLGWIAVVIGVAAMGLTMIFPDDLQFYTPIFHLNAFWLLATGIIILKSGFRTGDIQS